MKTKFRKLQNLVWDHPELSALIVSAMITVPMAIMGTLSLPDKSLFNLITAPIFILLCVGGLFWWMFAELFGEKRYQETRQQALKSGLEVMINQALIENGSITKPEQMVKL